MPCEMCGKDAPLKRAVVEGTRMRVCPDCLEYGQEVDEPKSTPASSGPSPGGSSGGGPPGGQTSGSSASGGGTRDVYEDTEEVLAEDYGDIVRQARDDKGLTIDELSDELNEKRSVIAKTEHGEHHPSDDLVSKLERFLDVELMVEMDSSQRVSSTGSGSGSSSGVTLGDLIKEEMDEED